MTFKTDQKVKVQATDDQFRKVNLLYKVTNGAVGTIMDDSGGKDSPWRVRFNDDWWEFSEDMLLPVPNDTVITDCKIRGFKVEDVVKVVHTSEALSVHVAVGAVGKIILVGDEKSHGEHRIKVRFNNDWWWCADHNLVLQPDDTEITDDRPETSTAEVPTNKEPLNVDDRVIFVGDDNDLEDVDISDYDALKFGSVGTVNGHADFYGGTVRVDFADQHWWLKPDKLLKVSAHTPVTHSRLSSIEEPRQTLKDGDAVMFLGAHENLAKMGMSNSDICNGAVGIVHIFDVNANPEYPLINFANISFYIRAKFLHRTYRSQTNSNGSDPKEQAHSAHAYAALSTFTPTNEVFTMLTLKTIYTLNGDNVEQLSVEQINSRIQREEEEIEAMKKGKAKTKAYQREIAKREANLADIIAFFDSRDEETPTAE